MAVEGQQDVLMLFQSQDREPYWLYQAVAVIPYCIDQDVAYIVDCFIFCSCLIQVAIGHHAGCEQIVGKSVCYHTIDFFGHGHIERTGAGYEMCHFYILFFGYDRTTHSCSEVIDYQNYVRRVFRQFTFKGDHYSRSKFCRVIAVYTQIGIGSFHMQICK